MRFFILPAFEDVFSVRNSHDNKLTDISRGTVAIELDIIVLMLNRLLIRMIRSMFRRMVVY